MSQPQYQAPRCPSLKRLPPGRTWAKAALTKLSFGRRTTGRKTRSQGRTKCKATKRPPRRKADRCTVYVAAGSLTRKGKRGTNSVTFTGRVGSKPLARATYRLTAVATDAAGNRSKSVTATFKIVAATRPR